MSTGIRWTVTDRYGNSIYLTDERWEHIVVIVLYRFRERAAEIISNNYIVTAYQKEIG